jgi:hypothetical protein
VVVVCLTAPGVLVLVLVAAVVFVVAPVVAASSFVSTVMPSSANAGALNDNSDTTTRMEFFIELLLNLKGCLLELRILSVAS